MHETQVPTGRLGSTLRCPLNFPASYQPAPTRPGVLFRPSGNPASPASGRSGRTWAIPPCLLAGDGLELAHGGERGEAVDLADVEAPGPHLEDRRRPGRDSRPRSVGVRLPRDPGSAEAGE